MTATPLPTALAVRRWAVIAAAGLSGVLVMLSMIVDPAPSASGREMIVGYAEHSFRAGLHTNLIHYGFALFAPVAFAIVGLVRGRGAWLANVAGVLAVIGLSTLPGLVLLDFTQTAAVHAFDVDTAVAIDQQLGQRAAFIVILLPAMVSALLALPLAVAAMWRAGLVHWGFVVVALGAMLSPYLGAWYVGFGLMMACLLVLAWMLWRLPTSVWDRSGPVVTEPVPAKAPAVAR